jgi:putative membrane protein insertion efficiency factor
MAHAVVLSLSLWPAGVVSAGMAGPPRGEPAVDAPLPEGSGSAFLTGLINGYRRYLSPLSAGRCRMKPSCSEYAQQAIRKHGPLKGWIMASGRLLHEMDQKDYSRPVMVDGKLFWEDPLESNDFWWFDGDR